MIYSGSIDRSPLCTVASRCSIINFIKTPLNVSTVGLIYISGLQNLHVRAPVARLGSARVRRACDRAIFQFIRSCVGRLRP